MEVKGQRSRSQQAVELTKACTSTLGHWSPTSSSCASVALSPVHTRNNVKATLSQQQATLLPVASTMLPFSQQCRSNARLCLSNIRFCSIRHCCWWVLNSLNGCSRPIYLVFETVALYDAWLGAPCINFLTYLLRGQIRCTSWKSGKENTECWALVGRGWRCCRYDDCPAYAMAIVARNSRIVHARHHWTDSME